MSKPYIVTITGADDDVYPSALQGLSREFGFVEWGLLVSTSRQGTARYPTAMWRDAMVGRAHLSNRQMFTSWHACGACSTATVSGADRWVRRQRMQINGYLPGKWRALARLASLLNVEFILQCRSEADLPSVATDACRIRGASVLYDPSAGSGRRPERWPETPTNVKVGFAGGIGPDNVLSVIEQIGTRGAPYWIDMETGVRTDDKFDLAKVRRVLEQVASL